MLRRGPARRGSGLLARLAAQPAGTEDQMRYSVGEQHVGRLRWHEWGVEL
jgi:hypothetical protein